MLVEGFCNNGHPLVCTIRHGRLRGAVVRGGVRAKCPECGAGVSVTMGSETIAVSRPSSPGTPSGT
jgi:hypothetical protein